MCCLTQSVDNKHNTAHAVALSCSVEVKWFRQIGEQVKRRGQEGEGGQQGPNKVDGGGGKEGFRQEVCLQVLGLLGQDDVTYLLPV